MEAFAGFIRDVALPAGLLTNPVVDNTGLKGAVGFRYQVQHAAAAGTGRRRDGDDHFLVDAIDKLLGLKLEPQKIPLAVLLVRQRRGEADR